LVALRSDTADCEFAHARTKERPKQEPHDTAVVSNFFQCLVQLFGGFQTIQGHCEEDKKVYLEKYKINQMKNQLGHTPFG
jgi:hypothetical protein